jgi:2-keto-4-pentenoate hydratase/2-oxohepta-3-ene-1,7-dioic acid hydratase in catechol pathway
MEVAGPVDDFDARFFAEDGLRRLRSLEARPTRGLSGIRVGAPVARPGKIVCVGLNYREPAREGGQPIPEEPVLFLKTPYTVVGPNDEVLIPPGSTHTDYEVELAVVIGRTARYLDSPEGALAHVAGYAVVNDVSERAFQLDRGGQWDKGKNCETFNPMGPWLVTADEVPDPQRLTLTLTVNDEVRQHSSTADMIFDVAYLIWYISQFMVLEPGDVINTGTPQGVGLGQRPPTYLEPGDVVALSIGGLGTQRQRFRQATR